MSQATPQPISTETIQSAIRGQRDAFADIYSRFYPICYGYFHARVLDGSVAADLSQDVFVRIFSAIARFDITQRFDAWLMGICRNVLREHVRRSAGRREIAWTELCLELGEVADQEGIYDDMLALVPGCMSKLLPATETIMRSHYFDGKKLTEIAADSGRTVTAIRMLVMRARRAIKSCIRRRLQEN